MYDTVQYLKMDRAYQLRLKKKYQEAIKGLPKGGLTTTVKDGKIYYYSHIKSRGKYIRKYIGTGNTELVLQLQKKHFLKVALKRIEENLKVIEALLRKYKSINPIDLQNDFPRAYKTLPQYCFDEAGVINPEKWGNELYEINEKYAESLKHKTNNGETVRSKSEVLIANALSARGIKYKYEKTMMIGGYEIAPDFQVLVRNGRKMKLWEHIGMLSDDSYLESFFWKLNVYIHNGYIPWKNLILTFDDENGNINTMEIEHIIDCFF